MSSTKSEVVPEFDAKPFRMVCIYDSASSSREAAYASEVVLRELGEDFVVDRKAWHVDALDASADLEEAANEASRADVIVLALAGETPSESLRTWTEQWQGKRSLDSGLIALIPSGDSETGGGIADFLYETAVTAHMDFLCRKKRRFNAEE